MGKKQIPALRSIDCVRHTHTRKGASYEATLYPHQIYLLLKLIGVPIPKDATITMSITMPYSLAGGNDFEFEHDDCLTITWPGEKHEDAESIRLDTPDLLELLHAREKEGVVEELTPKTTDDPC